MSEIKLIINEYNENLDADAGMNDKKRESFISVLTDIKTDIEKQIKQIEQSKLLLNNLNSELLSIRFFIQSIKQGDKIILP
jgi:hypothetical protein